MRQSPAPARPENEQRRDVHNPNIDQDAAESDLCGTLDLRTGRICLRPALHADGCEFQSPAATP